jgi:hypothetical protein
VEVIIGVAVLVGLYLFVWVPFRRAKRASDELDARLAERTVYRDPAKPLTKSQRMADYEYSRQTSRAPVDTPTREIPGELRSILDGEDELHEELEARFRRLADAEYPGAPPAAREDMAFWMAKVYRYEELATPEQRRILREAARNSADGMPADARAAMLRVPWQRRYLEVMRIA